MLSSTTTSIQAGNRPSGARRLLTRFGAMAMILVLATACAQTQANKQGIGTIIGAGLGGLAGANIGKGGGKLVAVGAGTLIGAMLGNEVGASLDRADKAYMRQAEQQATTAPVGETIKWSNPDSGHSGTVVATREGTTANTGKLCREYHTTVDIGGKQEEAYGTACREADGSWTIVK